MPQARLSNPIASVRLANPIANARVSNLSVNLATKRFAGKGYLIGWPLAYTYTKVQTTSSVTFGDAPHVRINNI